MVKHILFVLGLFCLCLACQDNKQPKGDMTLEQEAEQAFPKFEELNDQIRKDPKNSDLFFQRAQYWFAAKRFNEATVDGETAIILDSSKMDYFLLLSNAYLNNLQSRQALKTLDRAMNIDKENRDILIAALELQFSLKQYDRAIGTSQLLLKQDRQDEDAFFYRGLIFKEKNLDSLAIINFQRAVDINPSNADAFILLGDLHEKKSDPLAERYYENAVRAAENDINALHSLAFYQQNHGKMEEAKKTYEQIMAIDSSYIPGRLNLAIIQLEQGQFDQAEQSLVDVLELDSTESLGHFFMAQTLEYMNRPEEAYEAYKKSVYYDPDNLDAVESFRRLEKIYSNK